MGAAYQRSGIYHASGRKLTQGEKKQWHADRIRKSYPNLPQVDSSGNFATSSGSSGGSTGGSVAAGAVSSAEVSKRKKEKTKTTGARKGLGSSSRPTTSLGKPTLLG